MRTTTLHAAIHGWPADEAPNQLKHGRSYLALVADNLNASFQAAGLDRRVTVADEGFVLPEGWRPVSTGPLDPEGFDIGVLTKRSPTGYTGHGYPTTGVLPWQPDGSKPLGWSVMEAPTLDLAALNDRDRDQLLHTPVHECGHLWGCAMGEMYDDGVRQDATRTTPTLHLDARDPRDPYWAPRAEWLKDPMVRNDGTRWCEVNRRILAGKWTWTKTPRPATWLRVSATGLPRDTYVQAELWRDNPTADEDGVVHPRQELLNSPLVASENLADGTTMSLLAPGESPDVLSSLQLFLVKLRWQGGSWATWVSTWDMLLDEQGLEVDQLRVHVDFTKGGPPPLPEPAPDMKVTHLRNQGCMALRVAGVPAGTSWELQTQVKYPEGLNSPQGWTNWGLDPDHRDPITTSTTLLLPCAGQGRLWRLRKLP